MESIIEYVVMGFAVLEAIGLFIWGNHLINIRHREHTRSDLNTKAKNDEDQSKFYEVVKKKMKLNK